MTSDELKIDKRIVERNIKHGRLDAAEYQRMLSALPDLSDKVWRKPQQAAVEAPAAAAPAPSAPAVVESEPPTTAETDVESALPQAPANYFSQG
jgi:hypothetical protein